MASSSSCWIRLPKWVCVVSSFLLAANLISTVVLADLPVGAAVATCTAAVLFIICAIGYIAEKRWVLGYTLWLVLLVYAGAGLYWLQTRQWIGLLPSLLLLVLLIWRGKLESHLKAQPGSAPNDGPTAPVDNTNAPGGPPSVSRIGSGMRRPSIKVLVVLLAIVVLACILGVWFLAGPKGNPTVSVTYMGAIDGKGHWKLRFAITNVGNSTVFTSTLGNIEVFNRTNALRVGATAPMGRLAPGEGHVVDAVLSEAGMKSIDAKWRYSCLYAGDGLRSRIYRWQWGPKGPGVRVNWLIPQTLKGMPLTVISTSDWIEP
jgi:hypothetical protein